MKIYRQGDVLLRKVKSIPSDAKAQAQERRIVLAHGEVTGHAHAIDNLDDAVDVYVTGTGELYLCVKEASALRHEEHAEIMLPVGNYVRVIQREYQAQGIRNVQD